jgi:uncharacterized protein with PQ loop repeat
MNGDIHGHIHLRRRAHRGNSVHYAYPSSNHFIKMMDRMMYAVGIIGPLVSIPQLIEIYARHNAQGISILSWTGYAFLSALWFVYGVVHREKPIILTQFLWLLVNLSVIVGAALYK